jgi:hypothetical protein
MEGNVIKKGKGALSFIACFIYNNHSFGPSPIILFHSISGMQGIVELAKGSWSASSFFVFIGWGCFVPPFVSALLPILISLLSFFSPGNAYLCTLALSQVPSSYFILLPFFPICLSCEQFLASLLVPPHRLYKQVARSGRLQSDEDCTSFPSKMGALIFFFKCVQTGGKGIINLLVSSHLCGMRLC